MNVTEVKTCASPIKDIVEIKNLKKDSTILIALIKSKFVIGEEIVIPNTESKFKLVENNMNLIFDEIRNDSNNDSFVSKLRLEENKVFNSKRIEKKSINYFYTYYPEHKAETGHISYEIFEFSKKTIENNDLYHIDLFDKFVNMFNKYVIKYLLNFYNEIAICCVPSHDDCGFIYNEMSFVIKNVKKKYKPGTIIDGSDILYRKYEIEKAAYNNVTRIFKRQYDSLDIRYKNIIKDKTVLLIDDIYTSGHSINACKQKLLENGAKEVILFTFARTR